MIRSRLGPIDYQAISTQEHARRAEICPHTEEVHGRACRVVEQQAKDLLAKLGPEKLQRIAAYRAWRWSSLAGTTELEKNREWRLARSEAWQRHAGSRTLS